MNKMHTESYCQDFVDRATEDTDRDLDTSLERQATYSDYYNTRTGSSRTSLANDNDFIMSKLTPRPMRRLKDFKITSKTEPDLDFALTIGRATNNVKKPTKPCRRLSLKGDENLLYKTRHQTPSKSVKSCGKKAMDSFAYTFTTHATSTKKAVTSLTSVPSQSDRSAASDSSYYGKYEPLITANHTMSSYALEAENQELFAHITKMNNQLDRITRGCDNAMLARTSMTYTTFNNNYTPLERELNSVNQKFEETLSEYDGLATRLKQLSDPIYIAEIAMRTDKIKAQTVKIQKETQKAMKAADVDEKVLKAIETGKKEPVLLREANEIASKVAKAQRKLESLQDKNSNFSLEKEIKEERLKELEDICQNLESIENYYFGIGAVESPKVEEYISAAVEINTETFVSYDVQAEQNNDKYYRAQVVEDIESLLVSNSVERDHFNRLDNIVKEQRELINEIIAENKSKSEREIKAIMGRTLEDWEELERKEAEAEALLRGASYKSGRGLSTPPSLRSTDSDEFNSEKKTKKVVFGHVIREESETNDSPQIQRETEISPRSDKANILIREVDIRLDNEKMEGIENMSKAQKAQIAEFLLNGEDDDEMRASETEIIVVNEQKSELKEDEFMTLNASQTGEDEEEDDAEPELEEDEAAEETTEKKDEAETATVEVLKVEKAEQTEEAQAEQPVENNEEAQSAAAEQRPEVKEVSIQADITEVDEGTEVSAQEIEQGDDIQKTEEGTQTIEQQAEVQEGAEEKVEEPSAGINSKPAFKRSIKTKVPVKPVEAEKVTVENGEQTEEAMFVEKEEAVEVSCQADGSVAVEILADRQATEKTIGAGDEVISQRYCTDEVGVQADGLSTVVAGAEAVPEEKQPEELVLPEFMAATNADGPVVTKEASVGTIDFEGEHEYNGSAFFSVGGSQISGFAESKTDTQTVVSIQRTTFMNTGFGSTGRINKLRMGSNQDMLGTFNSGKSLAEIREEQEKLKLEKQRETIRKKLLESKPKRPQSRGRYIPRPHLISKGCGPDEVNTVPEGNEDSWAASSAWEYSRDASITNGSIMVSVVVRPKKVSIAVGTDGYFDPDMSLGGEQEVEDHQTLNKKRVPIKKKLMGKGTGNFFN